MFQKGAAKFEVAFKEEIVWVNLVRYLGIKGARSSANDFESPGSVDPVAEFL